MKNILLIPLLGALLVNNLSAQIYFDNPSFEDTTMTNSAPEYWTNCGQSPDIQPVFVGLSTRATDGDSFIGLYSSGPTFVEAVGQTIGSGLDTIPQHFEIDAAYWYQAPISAQRPTFFKIWLGNSDCERTKLIYTSPPLDSTWHRYTINFTPDTIYTTIIFSSVPESTDLYSNYIMLDNLSAIYEGYQPPLSTPTVQAAATITVSPNPSTGIYYINQSSDAPLLVYDINGQLLQHYAPHTAQIDLSHLTAGLYILSIGTDKQRLIKL